MSAVDDVLGRLQGVKKTGIGWTAKCPAHDDRHASLSVALGDEGRVLLKCHAGDGCSFDTILAALDLPKASLFESSNGTGTRREVATYDYEDEHGALLYQVVRFEPKGFAQRRPDGRGGWAWKLGNTRRVLYRLPHVIEGVKAGRTIYLVEGEKDVEALEAVGEIATCSAMGAGKWRDSYAKALRGADVIVVQDRDEEGRKHGGEVAASLDGVARSVRVVESAEGKDAHDHITAGKTADEFVSADPPPDDPDSRTTTGKPALESEKPVRLVDRTPPGLALEPDILAVFRGDLRLAGLAGEQQAAQITYLAVTSRLLPWGKATNRPVSGIGKGTTSTGKSYTQQTVLRFFPPEAYFDLGSMSKRYLVYSGEPLSHRFIVVPEWSSIAEDPEIVAMLRTLLSEGRLVHGTVEGDGRREARKVTKDGPTGLLMTTTAAVTDPELETRCLMFFTDDTPDQTRRVFEVLAGLEDEDESPVDFDRWHELQLWLDQHGENRVYIPYIDALSKLMPTGATRLRRDFVSLVCLIRSSAILHQCSRARDQRGRVVASIEDYATVYELMDAIVAEAVEATVSRATRETVEVVNAILGNSKAEHTSVKRVMASLGIGRSATYDRVRRAMAAGFLADAAETNERGLKIVLGGELPVEGTFLPAPDEVVRVASGEETGQPNPEPIRVSGPLSGRPGRPPTPPPDKQVRGRPLRPGEPGYLLWIAKALADGHITDREHDNLTRWHRRWWQEPAA